MDSPPEEWFDRMYESSISGKFARFQSLGEERAQRIAVARHYRHHTKPHVRAHRTLAKKLWLLMVAHVKIWRGG